MLALTLTILTWIGIVIGVVLLLVLIMPVHAQAAGSIGEEELDAAARVSWGWGLFALRWSAASGGAVYLLGLRAMRVQGDASKKERKRDRKAEKKRDKAKKKKRKKSKRGLGWLVEHRQTLLGLAGRLMRALGLRGRLWMRLGLDDPANTAALVQLLILLDQVVPGLELWVEPEYLEETLEADGEVEMRVWLLELLGIALARLLFDRQTRALLKPVRA